MLALVLHLRGPEFLLLYWLTGVAFIALFRWWQWARESAAPPGRMDLKDPLTIAYLRGGAREVLRVVIFSLIDRGLVLFDGKTLAAKSRSTPTLVRRSIEKAVLEGLRAPMAPRRIIADHALRAAGEQYAETLRERGLVAADETYAARRPWLMVGLLILIGTGGAKIVAALASGHHNVLFLIISALLLVGFLYSAYRRHRTARGDEALKNLKVLLAARKDRRHRTVSGAAGDDALLLAAVYGFGGVLAEDYPYLKTLFGKNSNSSRSCNTSCSSGCSSGCGGGGCGGGCGGCGS